MKWQWKRRMNTKREYKRENITKERKWRKSDVKG